MSTGEMIPSSCASSSFKIDSNTLVKIFPSTISIVQIVYLAKCPRAGSSNKVLSGLIFRWEEFIIFVHCFNTAVLFKLHRHYIINKFTSIQQYDNSLYKTTTNGMPMFSSSNEFINDAKSKTEHLMQHHKLKKRNLRNIGPGKILVQIQILSWGMNFFAGMKRLTNIGFLLPEVTAICVLNVGLDYRYMAECHRYLSGRQEFRNSNSIYGSGGLH